MCGIAGIFGQGWDPTQLAAMVNSQRHRGPDAEGVCVLPSGLAGLGHNRLSIIDLSDAGRQPMASRDGRFWIVFNGEIYNYLELRAELGEYTYSSRTDTEVVLAAYERWGEACVERFIGMFAFLLWDAREQQLFAARDRFGVKPLYYTTRPGGELLVASEIKALHAAGLPAAPDETAWANFLVRGLHDHSARTFWRGVSALPPGHSLTFRPGELRIRCWYDLAERVGVEYDGRDVREVESEYTTLLTESVKLRFRSDVPVGINLSGGLDSSMLLGLVHKVQGAESEAKAFTFYTGDPRYDELPWVKQMLAQTSHPLLACRLSAAETPLLAEAVQHAQDEPFGGLPTLAYAKIFSCARQEGVVVLLDGQGMDEQWAGYDYYAADRSTAAGALGGSESLVQGVRERPVRPECLTPEFQAMAEPFVSPHVFPDELRNLQYRDARYTKIPRVLRFNDRISMRASTELREPFLDHRLFELALRQPPERKIQNGVRKLLLRQLAARLLPTGVAEAPKRPLQTPQREWLRGELRYWAQDMIETALTGWGQAWLKPQAVRAAWQDYCAGAHDNSFYVWQWVNLGLMSAARGH